MTESNFSKEKIWTWNEKQSAKEIFALIEEMLKTTEKLSDEEALNIIEQQVHVKIIRALELAGLKVRPEEERKLVRQIVNIVKESRRHYEVYHERRGPGMIYSTRRGKK